MDSLSARWNHWYNDTPLIPDAATNYLLSASLRVLLAFAAFMLLRALVRYVRAAVPGPPSAANALYWMRWWLWLRLRTYAVAKLGTLVLAAVLLGQVAAGMDGSRAMYTPSLAAGHFGLFLVLVGMAQFVSDQTRKLLHPPL